MNSGLIGLKLRFGKYNWIIIKWEANGCMLLCDILGRSQFFRQAWDHTYRFDVGEDVAWSKCELHDWLNNDFWEDAFSEEESACIVTEPCRIGDFTTDQVGVFILERSELIKYTNLNIDTCWTLDADVWDYDEEAVTNEKYVQPVIWIDFALIDSLIPGWKELATNLAFSDNNDFGIPNPVQFYKKLTENYSLAIVELLEMLKRSSESARKYYYEQIYEVLYDMARNDDSTSINKLFELCTDLAPEGYYSYDQMLPLGEAIENEAYNAISALVDNGCNINIATWNSDSTIEIASSLSNPSQMILFLLEKGCMLAFDDAFFFWSENQVFAKEIIEKAKCFDTGSGTLDGFLDTIEWRLNREKDTVAIMQLKQMQEFVRAVLETNR